MQFLRYLLFPFSILYGIIVWVRNYLYDLQIFKSTSYSFPIIVIGNLSVGGTGKTPMTAYMLDFLHKEFRVGILSRGYKRKSEGFFVANAATTVAEIGDEPFQLFSNFPEATIAVDADRRNGIAQLRKLKKLPEILLLDDAYQHRKVKAGFYMLLTTYDALYVNDLMLPTGNLRDTKNQAKRAACIIVTKCPEEITEVDKEKVLKKLNPEAHQKVYFTTISYSNEVISNAATLSLEALEQKVFTLVTGIAKPTYLVNYLKSKRLKFQHLDFPDHHNFSEEEIKKLQQEKMIVTTEKDYVRLKERLDNVFYLPIETKFLENEAVFQNQIHEFIKTYR